jgi:hypothetical protein
MGNPMRLGSKNGWLGLLFGTLFFLGASFLHTRSNHNWGCDFSMYIRQAINIVEGIPQTDNHYLYSPATSYYGPKAYPVGFPLLLAPAYAAFGNSVFHFECVIALVTFVFAILTWLYLHSVIGHLGMAFAFAVTLFANPWLITFKGDILSDIPFACAVLAIVFTLRNDHPFGWKKTLLAGTLAGYALLIRTAGLAAFAGVFLYILVAFVKKDRNFPYLRYLALSGIGVGFFILFQYVIFPAPTLGTYADSMNLRSTGALVLNNAEYYLQTLREIIPNAGPRVFQTVLYLFLVVGILCGFVLQLRSRIRYAECFFIAYMALLLAWPGLQGFRLLLPLAPIALGYAYLSLRKAVPAWTEGRGAYIFAGVLFLVTVGVFKRPVTNVHRSTRIIIDGPQLPAAEEAFAYVRENLPIEAAIGFRKPRALALYTRRSSVADPCGTREEVGTHYRRMGTTHVLVDANWTEECVKVFAKADGVSVWKNSRFELFSLDRKSLVR